MTTITKRRNSLTTWCRHYSREVILGDGICAAGVKVRAMVGGPDFGWATRMPCNAANDGPECIGCDKRSLLTIKESNAIEGQLERMAEATIAAMKLIHDTHSRHGVVACPACGGKLNFARSNYNGHLNAQCETVGCVSFME